MIKRISYQLRGIRDKGRGNIDIFEIPFESIQDVINNIERVRTSNKDFTIYVVQTTQIIETDEKDVTDRVNDLLTLKDSNGNFCGEFVNVN